jgi:hypothetical protein
VKKRILENICRMFHQLKKNVPKKIEGIFQKNIQH